MDRGKAEAKGLKSAPVPGPGEAGFQCTDQKNLFPEESIREKKDITLKKKEKKR
jgi:hypothetical protein